MVAGTWFLDSEAKIQILVVGSQGMYQSSLSPVTPLEQRGLQQDWPDSVVRAELEHRKGFSRCPAEDKLSTDLVT